MPKRQITLEHVLYISAFVIALGIRFINLGSAPLSEVEAQSAIQAYYLAEGELSEAVSQPAYTLLTSSLFSMFGSSEFLARLLPALVGFALVTLPLTLRDQLGKNTTLVLTFGLAFDPILVGMSRLAGSPILAYVFALAAGIAFYKGGKITAGILFGLMLLSGSTAIAGAFVMALAWAFSQVTLNSRKRRNKQEQWSAKKLFSEREFILSTFVTLILAGSFFLRIPSGLSAIGATLPNYLSGWQSPQAVPISQFILALIAYQPLALIFGFVAIARSFLQPNSKLVQSLSFWLMAGLLLTLTYPARQITDLVWVITPLWILAAIEIGKHLEWKPSDRMASIGQTGLTLLLLTFLMMFTARSATAPAFSFPDSGFQIFGIPIGLNQQVITTFSIIGLVAVSSLLIASGWSKDAAIQGLVSGTTIFISLFILSSSFNNINSYKRTVNELWYQSPAINEANILISTLEEFSHFFTGDRTSLEVVYHPQLASLQWALRNMINSRNDIYLSPQDSPAAVITWEYSQNPSLSAGYRGQSIAWNTLPDWVAGIPTDLQHWFLFRDNDSTSENLILWLRSDIFPEDFSSPAFNFAGTDAVIP